MKILLVTMGLGIGGAETHIIELAKGLQKKGNEVEVVSNGGKYESELEKFNIKYYHAPLHNKNIKNVIESYKILEKIIKNGNFDIVHGHARIPSFICGLLQKKLKFNFVTTAHGTFDTKHGLKYITNWGDKTIAVSEDIKKYLLKNYRKVKKENIVVTVNGIDTERFSNEIDYQEILNEFSIQNENNKIVHVSRLDKNTTLVANKLIDISDVIYQKNSNIEIIIVGNGNNFEELKNKAEEKNKKVGYKLVKMVGGRTDVNKFTSMGDIFIGVSRAILEAMATKKPVIIAGNDGYIGIFDENKLQESIKTNFCCRNGIIVNEEQLEKDICILLNYSAEEKERLGIYNRDTVKKYYSIDKMVEDNLKVYNSFFEK